MRATPPTHTQRSVRVPSPPPGWWPELGGGGFGSEQGKTPGPPAAGTGERFFRGQVAGGGAVGGARRALRSPTTCRGGQAVPFLVPAGRCRIAGGLNKQAINK